MNTPKNLLGLHILEILRRYSDEEHRLTQQDIAQYLRTDYDLTVDRKAIRRHLENLLETGYELKYNEITRRGRDGNDETIFTDWYIGHSLTDEELRLLVDGLMFSNNITRRECDALIEKLCGLTSVHFSPHVTHIRTLHDERPLGDNLFETIEILDEAIESRLKVEFKYNTLDIDRRLHPRRNGRPYTVNPYQISAANGHYYLIGNYDRYDTVSTYRLDLITDIRLTDTAAKPTSEVHGIDRHLRVSRHMEEHIYSSAGDNISIRFLAARHIAGEIVDWFGSDAEFSSVTEDGCIVTAVANENAVFGWLMQNVENVELIEPQSLRLRLRDAAQRIISKYGG